MKKHRSFIVWFTCLKLFFVACSVSPAMTTVGIAASADTQIVENRPDTVFGQHHSLAVTNFSPYRSRALYRFDLGAIPADQHILSATLKLRLGGWGWNVPLKVTGHKVLVPWNETTTAWNTFGQFPGSGGIAGTDYQTDPVFGHTITANQGANNSGMFVEFDVTDMVREWHENPSTNFGIYLTDALLDSGENPDSIKYFLSRESWMGTDTAPRLSVTYSEWSEPINHGVANPVSRNRGTVSTVDADGRPVALVWLQDHRGGYALLMIDALTGQSEQFPVPSFAGDEPFASILSSRNRFYSHYGSRFFEFDPVQRAFTFVAQTAPRIAMSLTEDDNGVIWMASYPQSGVTSYNPETGEFRDFGHVYTQNWLQYPRTISADDTGWIYLGIGMTAGQIVALNPQTGQATPLIPEAERREGRAVTQRDVNGKVYAWQGGVDDRVWWELYEGQITQLASAPHHVPKTYIAGTQDLFHRDFPTGERLLTLDLVERRMSVRNAQGQTYTVEFDYTSEGALLIGSAAAPDGTISGGSYFPFRFFSYNPQTDQWINRNSFSQWNALTAIEDRLFIGVYPGGHLLEWDPSQPWVSTSVGNPNSNPLHLAQTGSDIDRPHALLAHPDGRHVILAGTPGYGLTGGGLLIWDRLERQATILTHTDLLQWQSTMSMIPLPDGKFLGGTTIEPGTGGQTIAKRAELYIFDLATRQIEWHDTVFPEPNVGRIRQMIPGPNGLIFGFMETAESYFFVFDPATKQVVHKQHTFPQFGHPATSQSSRFFIQAPDGRIFILFRIGLAQLNPETFEITLVAEAEMGVSAGGDWLDGRIYFSSGPFLYSWKVPPIQNE